MLSFLKKINENVTVLIKSNGIAHNENSGIVGEELVLGVGETAGLCVGVDDAAARARAEYASPVGLTV